MRLEKQSFKKLSYSLLSASIMFCAAQHNANAAGFYIQEQSVKGLGTAFAGSTTSINDASTIFFNPAGMTDLSGAQINAGVHLLIPDGEVNNDSTSTAPPGQALGGDGGNPYSLSPIPNFYAAAPLNKKLWAGIGVSAPFGLGGDYNDGWFGRYDSTKTELKTINITPALALEATDWLSIGLGLDVQYADAELESAAFVGAGTEGISTLKGDDWSYGFNAGVKIKPRDDTEIGLHYRSGMQHELNGNISLQGTGVADFSEGGSADLSLPDIATIGLAHDLNDQWRLMAQMTWFGWSNFDEIRPIRDSGGAATTVVQDYDNSFAFAVGAEYEMNETWTLRAGYQYDQTPTNDTFRTSRTPDGDRNWFSGGATYKLNSNLEFDFAATYIDISEEKINVTRNNGVNPALAGNVNANTDGYVGIVALGLNYKF